MPDAVLIFTFSPVQPFIVEARRAADLYAGSQILVELARAAAESLKTAGELIFPADLTADIPNRLVASLPFEDCPRAADAARQALLNRWSEICQEALTAFDPHRKHRDQTWEEIWSRQTAPGYFWEVYWAAASQEGRGYRETYLEADRALNAAKRQRAFIPAREPGLKDTLSGRRQALRSGPLKADQYWKEAASRFNAAKLRPNGRERLDSLGLVKRFGPQTDHSVGKFNGFPSTSTVASQDFLARIEANETGDLLYEYRQALNNLNHNFFKLRHNQLWEYDGDLFYIDTLTPKRLQDDFGLSTLDPTRLKAARQALIRLYESPVGSPSPYYAVIALDGDNMGQRINACLEKNDHNNLSLSLSRFAARVPELAKQHQAFAIYNGGDDVLALAPLSTAYELASQLADAFMKETMGTASAGIAISHHQSPLSAALRAARQAEALAKQIDVSGNNHRAGQKVPPKAAICVIAMKRSGETVRMRSKWADAGNTLQELVSLLTPDSAGKPALSSRFVYDFGRSVYALPVAGDPLKSELKRQLRRHRDKERMVDAEVLFWADRLNSWAAVLPDGADELSRWLYLARFIAQGGGE